MTERLNRDAVLVAGASGGIGGATVRALAERGMAVYATVRGDPGPLAGVEGVRILEMDVADPDSVALAAKTVAPEVGERGLRAVVNNAGVIVQGALELIPPAELRRQFEVNTLGPTYVTQAFLSLVRRGRGRIVNVSAPTAWLPAPFLAPIGASKAALESLSTALRGELAVWNVPVVMIQPGATQTQIFERAEAAARAALDGVDPARVEMYERQLAAVAKAGASQRLGPPEKVAKTIVKAVEARRPKRWYAASGDVRVMRMVSRLPAGLRARLIARMLGLSRIEPVA